MADYRRSEIVSGLFILLAVAVFALFAFKTGGIPTPGWFKESGTTCVSFFPDVKTLEEGVKVSIGGRRVGEVRSIRLASPDDADFRAFLQRFPGAVRADRQGRAALRVEFEVFDQEDVRLDRETATVILATDSFLGTHFLKLEQGVMKAGGTRLEDLKGEAPIAVAPGPLTGLDWFMEEGSAIMQRVRDILDKVDQRLLAEKNLDAIDKTLADLEGAMAAARSFAEGLPSLLDRGNETGLHAMVMQPLNDLLVNANRSLDELRDHLLKTTLKQADDLILSAKDAVQDARTAIQRVDAILVEGNPKIQAILDDLVKTADGLDGRIQSVQDQLNGLLGDGRDALAEARPEIIETLQSLRRTMWEVEMAARKVRANPAVILWGDDEPVLDVLPVDESGVQRTGRARPFGQRDDK